MLQAPDSPDKAVGIKPQHIDNLLTVAIQDFDYIIVDLPKEIDAITMKVLDRSNNIYVVFQPVMAYLRALTKILHLFNLLGYEPQKIVTVVNRMDSASAISLEKMENAIQKPINWVFPNDFLNATESANTGIPIQKLQPYATISKVFSSIAHEIAELQPEAERPESWFSKWLK